LTARLGLVGDKPLGLIGLIDISDRAQAQEQLRQVQGDFAHAARVSMLGRADGNDRTRSQPADRCNQDEWRDGVALARQVRTEHQESARRHSAHPE
jgi:hypothetical protein